LYFAISVAPMPPVMIPKSISTPSLLSHIFVSKFCDALPFYRQEQQFKRDGVDLTRATMSNWAIRVANTLEPLVELLRLYILSGPLINVDETTVQVLDEPGRKNRLFSKTPEGARVSALFYSIIETAKANGLDTFKYICLRFKRIPYGEFNFEKILQKKNYYFVDKIEYIKKLEEFFNKGD